MGAVELLRCLAGDGLEGQHPGPQIRVVVVEVAQFRPLGVGAEPAAAPVGEGIDRRKQPCVLANVIKLVDAVQ